MKYPALPLLALSLSALSLLPTSARAQSQPSPQPQVQTISAKTNGPAREISTRQPPTPIQLRMEKFFLSVQNKQIQEAYTTLMADSELESKEDQMRDLITKTSNVLAEIGPITYWEIYENRTAGSRMIALTYFSYQQKKPLRWRFVFYAAVPDQWRVINLSVDDLVAEGILNEK